MGTAPSFRQAYMTGSLSDFANCVGDLHRRKLGSSLLPTPTRIESSLYTASPHDTPLSFALRHYSRAQRAKLELLLTRLPDCMAACIDGVDYAPHLWARHCPSATWLLNYLFTYLADAAGVWSSVGSDGFTPLALFLRAAPGVIDAAGGRRDVVIRVMWEMVSRFPAAVESTGNLLLVAVGLSPELSCPLNLCYDVVAQSGTEHRRRLLTACDDDGRTALHHAALHVDAAGVDQLLQWGCDGRAVDHRARTALHCVAGASNTYRRRPNRAKHVAEVLLRRDPHLALAPDDDGNVPLHCAVESHNFAVIDVLLHDRMTSMSMLSATNNAGTLPLFAHDLHDDNAGAVASCLLTDGADPSVRDARGETLLHAFIRAGNSSAVQRLLDDHAARLDWTARNGDGQTAGELCVGLTAQGRIDGAIESILRAFPGCTLPQSPPSAYRSTHLQQLGSVVMESVVVVGDASVAANLVSTSQQLSDDEAEDELQPRDQTCDPRWSPVVEADVDDYEGNHSSSGGVAVEATEDDPCASVAYEQEEG